jgi:hypothetical protein
LDLINGGGYGTGVDTSLDVAVSVVSICHSGDETNSTWNQNTDPPQCLTTLYFQRTHHYNNLHLEKERYLLLSIEHSFQEELKKETTLKS